MRKNDFYEETDKWEQDSFEEAEQQFSDRFKRKMNRLFRERLGSDTALHPEVDNAYERIRSKIIRQIFLMKQYFKRNNP